MIAFIDTSAFYALLDRDDANHSRSKKIWSGLLNSDCTLVTSNYVLVETFALAQHRLGIEAVRGVQEEIVPLLNIEWIKDETHNAGIGALLTASKRKLSFVDCVSFEIMRALGLKDAFAFDPHFSEQGFTLLT